MQFLQQTHITKVNLKGFEIKQSPVFETGLQTRQFDLTFIEALILISAQAQDTVFMTMQY